MHRGAHRPVDGGFARTEAKRRSKGEVTFHDWLLPEEAVGHGRVFSTLVIPPGASIGYHDHSEEFEAYLVLSGEATVNDNGEEIILHEGDMHMCKDGDGHGTENRSEEYNEIVSTYNADVIR